MRIKKEIRENNYARFERQIVENGIDVENLIFYKSFFYFFHFLALFIFSIKFVFIEFFMLNL